MGRICEVPGGASLTSLAESVSARLGVAVRVWGQPTSPLRAVALAPGSGRSLLADALTAGCDAIVTGELRYHESLDAAASGLAVVEAGHDATEWPLTRSLARIARETPGIAEDAIIQDEPTNHWWTAEGA
jgi:putative NIF3 family GTP cyclohydrolase 1 type 2